MFSAFSDFNMAFDLLNHLHGHNLIQPNPGYTTPLIGQMILFNQEAFMDPPSSLNFGSYSTSKWIEDNIASYMPADWGWRASGLFRWNLTTVKVPAFNKMTKARASSLSFDGEGFVYFPSACAQGFECSIHVALHGCKQGKYSSILLYQ